MQATPTLHTFSLGGETTAGGERAILARVTDSEPESTAGDALAAAWEDVERDWENDDVHRRFLALCAVSDRLAEAGQRYRNVRESDPTRAPSAKRQIDALLALATERLLLQKTPPPEKGTPRLTFIALGVALVIVGVTLWQLARLR